MRIRNGHLLRGHIEMAGHSYRSLEALTSIDDTTIAMLCTGRRQRLHTDKAERLAHALGVSVGALFHTAIQDATSDTAKGEGTA